MSGVRKRTWRSGAVSWEASWYDSDGRRHTANYDRRAEAEEARAEMLRQRARGGSGDPTAGGLTLADWHARWWSGRSVRPATALREDTIWRVHIAPTLGDYRLADLRRSDIASWVAGLTSAGLAAATVTRCLGALRTCLASAVEDGLVFTNPAARVSPPRVDPAERRFLTPVELIRLEAEMPSWWSLIVPFAATTGLRIGELAALQVRDLRLAAGEVHVRRTALEMSGHLEYGGPKSRAGIRTVPTVYPRLAERLAEHIADRGLGPNAWLFAGERGAGLRPNTWRARRWVPAVEAAGLPDPQPHPHAMRHTAIAAWLASGVPVIRAAAWAGHSPRVLEQTYSHLLDVDHEPVRAKLEELFGRG